MKFNWRANWEILLVLVIIVVGIVITTIAAIRNKDKHLVLPDETDFASQLLASGNAAGGGLLDPVVDSAGANQASENGPGHSTRRPPPVAKGLRPATNHQSDHHRNHQSASRASTGGPHDVALPSDGRHSKYDDSAEFSRSLQDNHHQSVTLGSNGSPIVGYEPASTEPPPYASSVSNHNGGATNQRHYTDKRQVSTNNRTTTPAASTIHQEEADSSESVDLMDDIHTTRSSMAGENGNLDSGSLFNSVLPSPHLDHTPSLSMHGPYGVTAPAVSQFGPHPSGHKGDSDEDMMTSYSKGWSSSNMTDALIRGDYNLASALANQSSSQQHQRNNLMNLAMLSNLLGPTTPSNGEQEAFGSPSGSLSTAHHRAYHGASLPVSVLLTDLLKLTRAQPSTGEQPANVKPPSILQQLRSLPGPLMSLLQSLSSTNNAEQSGYGGHDMSESNHHFHSVSMSPTDIHSILARSLRGTGVLPAFPPPKGVPQPWVPPTAGGDPSYQASHNSNADFVANNAAGFIRDQQMAEQQQRQTQQQQSSNEASSQQYQRQSQETAYQRPVSQEVQYYAPASELSNQQVPLGAPQQQQQQQQQQQVQQPSVFVPNQNERSWPPAAMSFARAAPIDDRTAHYKKQGDFGNYQQQQQQSNNLMSQPFNLNMIGGQPPGIQQQAPAYNSRPISEMPVPLGYNSPTNQPQQSIQQSPLRAPLEFNAAAGAVESKPKISIVAGPIGMPKPSQLARGSSGPATAASQPKSLVRRRRSVPLDESKEEEQDRDDKVMSGHYSGHKDEEDDADAPPISVVRPDGRPMSGGRVKAYFDRHLDTETDDRQVAGSQQSADHLSLRQRPSKRRQQPGRAQMADSIYRAKGSRVPFFGKTIGGGSEAERLNGIKHSKYAQRTYKRPFKQHLEGDNQPIEASSGLMSRLLGTASNNDETDDELEDDDGDSSSEKRKEELEDAEFGISNDNSIGNQSPKLSQATAGRARPSKLAGSADSDSGQHLGSGSTGSEAYARRNQQRSDIEFYGHPGEETRQLKYGILGSGNYEVVNGGIYPEADESTAAVNSVANYVRKPVVGGHLLASAASPFMPGGRVGGFMRGASAAPDEMMGILPADNSQTDYQRPLLEFIDSNGAGQLFDSRLLSQLSSTTRSTHASKEERPTGASSSGDREVASDEQQQQQAASRPKGNDMEENELELASTPQLEGDMDKYDKQQVARQPLTGGPRLEHNFVGQKSLGNGQRQPLGGNRSQGTNQFNSYQISPSRKVAIYSDQDLDSAPSDIIMEEATF